MLTLEQAIKPEFRKDVISAIKIAHREYDFRGDCYSKNFVALLVMFNTEGEQVECYNVREYEGHDVKKAIEDRMKQIIKLNPSLEYVSTITAKEISEMKYLPSHYGFNPQRNEMFRMEMENFGLKFYNSIIDTFFY